MTEEDIYRAREAQRLLNEPLLIEAMEAIRQDAFAAFLTTPPGEFKEIARLQAIANGAHEIRDWLGIQIAKATETGWAPNEPTGTSDPGS